MLVFFKAPLLSQNKFSGPANGTPKHFKLIIISTIMSLAILSTTISETNVLDLTVFWRFLKDLNKALLKKTIF